MQQQGHDCEAEGPKSDTAFAPGSCLSTSVPDAAGILLVELQSSCHDSSKLLQRLRLGGGIGFWLGLRRLGVYGIRKSTQHSTAQRYYILRLPLTHCRIQWKSTTDRIVGAAHSSSPCESDKLLCIPGVDGYVPIDYGRHAFLSPYATQGTASAEWK